MTSPLDQHDVEIHYTDPKYILGPNTEWDFKEDVLSAIKLYHKKNKLKLSEKYAITINNKIKKTIMLKDTVIKITLNSQLDQENPPSIHIYGWTLVKPKSMKKYTLQETDEKNIIVPNWAEKNDYSNNVVMHKPEFDIVDSFDYRDNPYNIVIVYSHYRISLTKAVEADLIKSITKIMKESKIYFGVPDNPNFVFVSDRLANGSPFQIQSKLMLKTVDADHYSSYIGLNDWYKVKTDRKYND